MKVTGFARWAGRYYRRSRLERRQYLAAWDVSRVVAQAARQGHVANKVDEASSLMRRGRWIGVNLDHGTGPLPVGCARIAGFWTVGR